MLPYWPGTHQYLQEQILNCYLEEEKKAPKAKYDLLHCIALVNTGIWWGLLRMRGPKYDVLEVVVNFPAFIILYFF